jgi:hypothetical protein
MRWGQAEVAMMVMMVLLVHSPDWPIDNAHENQLNLLTIDNRVQDELNTHLQDILDNTLHIGI